MLSICGVRPAAVLGAVCGRDQLGALIRIQARADSAQPSVVAVEVLRSGWIGIYFQGRANSLSFGIGCGGGVRERERRKG